MQLLVLVYLIFFFKALYSENLVYIGSVILAGIIIVLAVVFTRKHLVKKTKKLVEKYEKDPDAKIEPFVNVNRADWYVLQELPHLSRVQAKKVVWLRKYNGWYTSLDDFFNKNNIYEEEHKNVLSKLIKIK